jgi:hypothetical protein
MASARPVGRGFSPLDEELALLPGSLTPHLHEELAHLGTWMPFAPAAAMLQRFTQVSVSTATAQRQTEVVGRAAEALQLAEVARIAEELPPAAAGPERALLSVDGAMVPLRHGEWAETKTLVVGEVAAPLAPTPVAPTPVAPTPVAPTPVAPTPVAPTPVAPAPEVHADALSYFSRRADAETFGWLALGEIQRRGVEHAGQVAAVSDGAEWIQGFVDLHCPQALRILDFAHAAERVAALGEALAPADPTWLPTQLHRLKHEGPQALLTDLQAQVAAHPAAPALKEHLSYLNKRVAQMQYPTFQADGWPLGSGVVESANKLVVEARLKGAGMHWERENVNPMLALRNAVCNDRWDETWAASSAELRAHPRPRCPRPPAPPPPSAPPLPTPPPTPPPPPKPHPWRRYPAFLSAKL